MSYQNITNNYYKYHRSSTGYTCRGTPNQNFFEQNVWSELWSLKTYIFTDSVVEKRKNKTN